jgi:Ca2+-binding EF-hand superfamily protein
LEQQAVSKKSVATNDEVASILKGLQLDPKCFLTRLYDSRRTEDAFPIGLSREASSSGDQDGSPKGKLANMKNKAQQKAQQKATMRAASTGFKSAKSADFDIYLGEALMPVLAQSLDALCRQHNRMNMQGDSLDPKVRARFNPITFLAQQLLRRHPKCAKTPRRQAIYSNFRDWADLERGRREMLRQRNVVEGEFQVTKIHGIVSLEDLIKSVDDKLHLQGILAGNKEIQRGILEDNATGWFDGRSFEQFWHRFSSIIMKHDVVSFTAFQRGKQLEQQLMLENADAAKAEEERTLEMQKFEDDQRRRMEEYTALYPALVQSEHILSILNEDKVLTGDDVRPGDSGFEFEVPPTGDHVALLSKVLILLGFQILEKDSEGKEFGDKRWWDDVLASAWATLQKIHLAEICDGVVEREVLEKIIVPPVGFPMLRNKVREELERLEDEDGFIPETDRRPSTTYGSEKVKKPSIDTLCHRLGITLSRMDWLHRLFESYLEGDGVSKPRCYYPEKPAAITKAQMRPLMVGLRPDMEDEEFAARFKRIDRDSSGNVEFDEFVTWVREDEVRVGGANPLQRMSYEELAIVYGQSDDLIKYLHDRFQDQLPGGETDDYPNKPKSLPKQEVRALLANLTPDMSDAEFELHFQATTLSKKDSLEFDEFMDVLHLDLLPEELLA